MVSETALEIGRWIKNYRKMAQEVTDPAMKRYFQGKVDAYREILVICGKAYYIPEEGDN